jgi:hypothetical protein
LHFSRRQRTQEETPGNEEQVTPTSSRLIAYRADLNREKKLFFFQNEPLETAIFE